MIFPEAGERKFGAGTSLGTSNYNDTAARCPLPAVRCKRQDGTGA